MIRPSARPTGRPHDHSPESAGQGDPVIGYRSERQALQEPVVPERRGRGPGEEGLRELADRLSGRDRAVLDIVHRHRFLTTGQIEGFCFVDHASRTSAARTARRVLARLERERLIERPARRVGGFGAGSAVSIWMLTSTGLRLVNLVAGRGAVGRARTPGERYIGHALAVADVHLELVQAARRRLLSVYQIQLEPASWRQFADAGGRRSLKPDLFAVTAPGSDREYEDHWFVEVDLATESLPTVIRQCRFYEAYRRSGQAQAEAGVFPRVVWVVPTETRASKLHEALTYARDLDRDLFRVVKAEQLLPLLRGDDINQAKGGDDA